MKNIDKIKLASKNQLTISKVVRDALNLVNPDSVVFQRNDSTVTPKERTNFWDEVNQQAQVYGKLNTDELAWGIDRGNEVTSE